MDYNVIADNFRYRKNELGYSYETLAEMTGMSKSTLQRYATGNIKNIPLHRLDTLGYTTLSVQSADIPQELDFGVLIFPPTAVLPLRTRPWTW